MASVVKSVTDSDLMRAGRRLALAWRAWQEADGMFPEPEFDRFMSACALMEKLTKPAKEPAIKEPECPQQS